MKKKTTRIQLLSVLIVLSLFSFGQLYAQGKNFLSTKGNKLYDASGKEVRLTGVNWFGFETSLVSPHGIWARDMKSMIKQIKDLGFNCIRVPWCNAMLADNAKVNISSFGKDPYTGVTPMNTEESLAKKPIELLDIFVKYCQENSIKIILDNHSRAADGYMNETLWYTPAYPESKWISDWVFITNRYKDYDAVIGMDLNNEPHGSSAGTAATWGNNDPATNWNKAAERCGNAILAANPNVLILVEGTELYNGQTYWWGGNLRGVRDYPIVLSKPNKLVYSPHEYGPEVFNQTWFNTPDFPANMTGIWNEHFGYLYNNNISPLLIGEFGIRENAGKSAIWFDTFMKYMGSTYSWTFWCWNPNSGDTGGLLEGDWSTLVTWKYNKLKPYLAPFIPNGTVGNVNTAPVASFLATPKTGVAPLAVAFDGSGSTDANGDVLTYAWSFGDGASGTGKTASHSYTVAGNYEAKLTVNDGKGGIHSVAQTIAVTSVGGNNAPLAKFTATPTTGTAPLVVALDASGSSDPDGDVLTYAWAFGDGTTSTAKTVSHTFAAVGTYEVKLTVKDSKGAVGTATAQITAGSAAASKLKVQYKVLNASPTDNQVNPMFQLVNSGTEAVPYSELTIRYWYTREGAVDQSFFCDFALIGSSKVVGKFAPVASPTTTANYYAEVGFATTAGSLVAGASSGDIQTRFAKNDWSPYNEANDYSYDPTKTAYTDWTKVTLYRKGQLVWGTEPTNAAAKKTPQETIAVRVYPNPIQPGTALSISFAEQDEYTVTITDMLGHVVLNKKVSAMNETIQFPALGKNGTYIVKAVNSKNQVVVKRVIQY